MTYIFYVIYLDINIFMYIKKKTIIISIVSIFTRIERLDMYFLNI